MTDKNVHSARSSLRAWLELWSDNARSARAYAAYCTAKAGELVDAGHLSQAEQQLREALAADRHGQKLARPVTVSLGVAEFDGEMRTGDLRGRGRCSPRCARQRRRAGRARAT